MVIRTEIKYIYYALTNKTPNGHQNPATPPAWYIFYRVHPSLNSHILFYSNLSSTVCHVYCKLGGGPGVVVSTAAFHARVRDSVPGLGGLKETKNVSSPSTCASQYCGEPP